MLFPFVTRPNIPITFDVTHSSYGNKTILDHSFKINDHQNCSKFREFPSFEITNCDVPFVFHRTECNNLAGDDCRIGMH